MDQDSSSQVSLKGNYLNQQTSCSMFVTHLKSNIAIQIAIISLYVNREKPIPL